MSTARVVEVALHHSLPVARPLSWVVVAAFLIAGLLASRDRPLARQVGTAAFLLFGAFWVVLVPHFVFEQRSIVQGIGSVALVPSSVYAASSLRNGRDSLLVSCTAFGLMGLLYLPFSYVPLVESNPLGQWLVGLVTDHTAFVLSAVGVDPTVVEGPAHEGVTIVASGHISGNTFYFPGNARPITYTIILACTGIGSIAILAGGVLAVSAPWRRKLRVLAVVVPVVYALNVVRNAFIAVAFGHQRMQWFVGPVTALFGLDDVQLVSYYLADRILAQFASIGAMVAIIALVVRELPEVLVIVEDVAFALTGREYDLTPDRQGSTDDADRADR